jgi:uncharacterized SAM-binding protein YcdF (DUF218 family)
VSGSAAIVVFGCTVTPGGAPSPALERRLRHALGLWRARPDATLVVSGGRLYGRPAEAGVMQAWLLAEGVPAARIILEAESLYTLDNAERVAPLLAALNVEAVTLVTEAYHMPRSERLLRAALTRHGVRARLETAPAPDDLTPWRRGAKWVREALATWRDMRRQPRG